AFGTIAEHLTSLRAIARYFTAVSPLLPLGEAQTSLLSNRADILLLLTFTPFLLRLVTFFELSVPLARNVKYASQVKRTLCVKCAFGTIAEHLTSLRAIARYFTAVSPLLHLGEAQTSPKAAYCKYLLYNMLKQEASLCPKAS
ncbi:MAG: hypothetical protein IJO93_04370, partial [Clostridia bacterium]|nr:hypothetical protein [Clostridia bacterium]